MLHQEGWDFALQTQSSLVTQFFSECLPFLLKQKVGGYWSCYLNREKIFLSPDREGGGGGRRKEEGGRRGRRRRRAGHDLLTP